MVFTENKGKKIAFVPLCLHHMTCMQPFRVMKQNRVQKGTTVSVKQSAL